MQYLVQPLISDAANAPGTSERRYYTLTSLASGHVLAADTSAGAVQEPWTEEASQQWRFVELVNGNYKVENRASGQVLTVASASMASGAPVIEEAWAARPSQQWRIIDLGTGQLRLEAVHSGLCLQVPGASRQQGVGQQQGGVNGTSAQTWLMSEVRDIGVLVDAAATVYEGRDYQGASEALGVGSHLADELGLAGGAIGSLRVPPGMRVTLYEQDNFRGKHRSFLGDAARPSQRAGDAASILVEKVATIYQGPRFGGRAQVLGVGRYHLDAIGLAGSDLGSLRVPQGLMVILHENDDFSGRRRVFFEDAALLDSDFAGKARSIIIKATGLIIPEQALQFGAQIALTGQQGTYVAVPDADLDARADQGTLDDQAKLTVVRAGHTKHNDLVSYGDVVALRHGQSGYLHVAGSGEVTGQGQEGELGTLFVIARAGATMHKSFVARGDVVAFESVLSRMYVSAGSAGVLRADASAPSKPERFTIAWFASPAPARVGATRGDGDDVVTGWASAAAGTPGATACGADICGQAACATAAALVSGCTAAAEPIAVCVAAASVAADSVAAASGAANTAEMAVEATLAGACAAAVGGLNACGADVCGGAACGAAACAAAACGAAACGVDASPAAVSALSVCVAAIGGVDACLADACGGNVCGINLCPADACAVDACAIDLIPIVPFI